MYDIRLPQCSENCETCLKKYKIKVLCFKTDENDNLIDLPDKIEWTCSIKEARIYKDMQKRRGGINY